MPTRVPLQSARAVGRDQTIRSWIGISRRAPGEGVPCYESSVETTHACGMAAALRGAGSIGRRPYVQIRMHPGLYANICRRILFANSALRMNKIIYNWPRDSLLIGLSAPNVVKLHMPCVAESTTTTGCLSTRTSLAKTSYQLVRFPRGLPSSNAFNSRS